MSDSRKICDVDFEGLGKTLSRIKDDEVKKLIKELMDEIKKRKVLFDENTLDENEYYNRVNEVIKASEITLKKMVTDRDSEDRAKNIMKRLQEYIKQYMPPVNNDAEVKDDPSCYTLSEQQAWLSDDEVKQHFENALTEISIKAKFILKSVYISHAFTNCSSCNTDEDLKLKKWVPSFLLLLRDHFKLSGFDVHMLPDYSYRGRADHYAKNIMTDKHVLLIGTPILFKMHNDFSGDFVQTEITYIGRKKESTPICLLISGDVRRSYPAQFELKGSHVDWVPSKDSKTYFQSLQSLLAMMIDTKDNYNDIWDAFLKKIPAEKAKRLTSPPIKNLIVNPMEMKTTLSNTSPVDSNVLILKKLDQLQIDQSKLLTLVQDDSKKHQENTQAILNKIDEAKDELIRKVEEIDSIIHQLSKSKVVSPVLSKSLERESSLTSKSLHFNARFKGLFGDFLSIAKHVAENKIPPDQKNVEVATSVFDKLMSLIPLPYMGLIANLLTSSIKYVDRSIQKSDAKKTNQALGEDVDVIAELAFKITSNYQRQIEKLSDKGIETLAQCARKRVVHFILSLDEQIIQSYCSFKPADKVEFLFLGIAKGKSSIKLHNRLETSNQEDDRKWTDDGLFLRSGWELPDRTQYICYADQQNKDNAVNKIKKYGFHLATLADKSFFEAHHFKFMLFAGSQAPVTAPPIDRSSKPKGLLANVNGSG